MTKAVDETKDQSYVLWGLQQDLLGRTLLPLGTYRKTEIRQMAYDYGYPELANKSESYEICFVPDNDYRGFLKNKIPGLETSVEGGSFVDVEGNIIGKHRGYPFYTIGQRKGLDIAFGKPVFVTKIDPDNNTVVLGDEEDLERLLMAHSPKLQAILEAARQRFRSGEGIPHETFWQEVDAETASEGKKPSRTRTKGRTKRRN